MQTHGGRPQGEEKPRTNRAARARPFGWGRFEIGVRKGMRSRGSIVDGRYLGSWQASGTSRCTKGKRPGAFRHCVRPHQHADRAG